jgi:hypothetical protein
MGNREQGRLDFVVRRMCEVSAPEMGSRGLSEPKAIEHKLQTDLESFAAVYDRVRRRSQRLADQRLGAHFVELDLALTLFTDLVLVVKVTRQRLGARVLWESSAEQAELETSHFQNLLFSLANDLLAMRRLFEDGLTGPVQPLFRAYVEKFHLCIAIVADKGLHDAYLAWNHPPDEGLDHWRKHLSPKRVKAIVDSLKGGPWRKAYVEFRRDIYARTSGAVHGHPIAVLLTVYAGAGDKRSGLHLSIGGRQTGQNKKLLEDLLAVNYELFSALLWTLVTVHGWGVPEGATADEADLISWVRDKWVLLRNLHLVRQSRRLKRSGEKADPYEAPTVAADAAQLGGRCSGGRGGIERLRPRQARATGCLGGGGSKGSRPSHGRVARLLRPLLSGRGMHRGEMVGRARVAGGRLALEPGDERGLRFGQRAPDRVLKRPAWGRPPRPALGHPAGELRALKLHADHHI